MNVRRIFDQFERLFTKKYEHGSQFINQNQPLVNHVFQMFEFGKMADPSRSSSVRVLRSMLTAILSRKIYITCRVPLLLRFFNVQIWQIGG